MRVALLRHVDLVVMFMTQTPSTIRWHYRQVIDAMVYRAIVD